MPEHKRTTRIYLLRGLARESRHWGEFLPKLTAAFTNVSLHPLEIPGSGTLHDQPAPITLDDYVTIIRQQYLRQPQMEVGNVIIGVSFGGMIAARWAERYPCDFDATVLINTSCRHSPILQRMLFSGALHLLSALCSRDASSREKKIVSLICNLADREKICREWTEIQRTAPVSMTNLLRQLYAAATAPKLAATPIPALILCSSRDRLVSVKCSAKIASLWRIQPIIHDRAGHDLTTDDPDWCSLQIQSWYQARSTRSCDPSKGWKKCC